MKGAEAPLIAGLVLRGGFLDVDKSSGNVPLDVEPAHRVGASMGLHGVEVLLHSHAIAVVRKALARSLALGVLGGVVCHDADNTIRGWLFEELPGHDGGGRGLGLLGFSRGIALGCVILISRNHGRSGLVCVILISGGGVGGLGLPVFFQGRDLPGIVWIVIDHFEFRALGLRGFGLGGF